MPNSLFTAYAKLIDKVPYLRITAVVIVSIIALALISHFKLESNDVFIYTLIMLGLVGLSGGINHLSQNDQVFLKNIMRSFALVLLLTVSILLFGFAWFVIDGSKPEFYGQLIKPNVVRNAAKLESSLAQLPTTKQADNPPSVQEEEENHPSDQDALPTMPDFAEHRTINEGGFALRLPAPSTYVVHAKELEVIKDGDAGTSGSGDFIWKLSANQRVLSEEMEVKKLSSGKSLSLVPYSTPEAFNLNPDDILELKGTVVDLDLSGKDERVTFIESVDLSKITSFPHKLEIRPNPNEDNIDVIIKFEIVRA